MMTVPPESTQPASPPSQADVVLSFEPRKLVELYASRRYDDLSEEFVRVLSHFEATPRSALTPQLQDFVNAFIKQFLNLFTQPDYIFADRHVDQFLGLNATISNLVAVSVFRTTDAWLELLRVQEGNFVKLLTLYSARNSVKLDRRKFFDLDAARASRWFSAFLQTYAGVVSEAVCRNLRAHCEFADERMQLTYEPQSPFYGSTYVDGKCDRPIKEAVNRTYRRLAAEHSVRRTPDPRKIAVLSGVWFPGHSVFRNYAHFARALREKYHLTFVRLGKGGAESDISLFDDVLPIADDSGRIDVSPLQDNDFQVAWFPDIGMTAHSIALANMRIAPIQITSPGHSVSTWGADIDYFVSGADVELRDNPEKNYSERLVLLPGCGVIHNQPLYRPRGRTKSVPELVLNCPWTPQKVNYRFCRLLQRVIDAAQKPLRFRLFSGGLQRCFGFVAFARELQAALRGAVLEFVGNRPYAGYMELMEEGDAAIDAFHFGGCNTIADTLFLRIPTVTYEGDKWYNRIGSQMLRMAGTPELIATSDDEYVEIVTRLIQDDDFRRDIHVRLAAADLDQTIFDTSGAGCFREAVDYLIAHHERLSRDPDRRAISFERDIRGSIAGS